MKPKRLLLIGGNFFPEPTGIGKFNGEMIAWLSASGFECTVITTSPYYPQWKVQKPYNNKWFKRELIRLSLNNQQDAVSEANCVEIIRCPHYVPANPSGMKRILSDVSFFVSSGVAVFGMLFRKRFDYVLTVAPPFLIGIHGMMYKAFKGGKFLYHIQDLQIEAARDLQLIRSKFLLQVLFGIEGKILNAAAVVSTISPGMLSKVQKKTTTRTILFPNWVDTDFFHPIEGANDLKGQFGFEANEHIVLYSGAIGEKQGLEIILDAAFAMKEDKLLRFVISGAGPYKGKLVAMAKERGLNNILFMDLQPLPAFNAFLNIASVHLVIQKKDASDLVMPSKLTSILSVGGVALVTAAKKTSLYDVIYNNDIGLTVEPENIVALVEGIRKAVYNDSVRLKKNARLYAENELAASKIIGRYVYQIERK